MNILGIGTIFTGGTGIASFENALRCGWKPPAELETPRMKDKKASAFTVDLGAVPDASLLKKTRRSDKFSRMAVLAASEALKDGNIEDPDKKSIAVIVATAFGAHVTTFDFLDGILEYGEAGVSPTTFSNSVHNAAASYVMSVLGIHGPALTVTNFYFCFQHALQLAQTWVYEGKHDYVLVGVVDQCGEVMKYVYDKKLTPSPDGRIKPFDFSPTCQVPGEGAAFFLLGEGDPGKAYCGIGDIKCGRRVANEPPADLNLIDADGMLADETAYKTDLSPDIPAAAYSPLFGSMMIGSAFNCAAGALMLKNQESYTNPVQDNPFGINLVSETKRVDIGSIRCLRYDCRGRKASYCLKKL